MIIGTRENQSLKQLETGFSGKVFSCLSQSQDNKCVIVVLHIHGSHNNRRPLRLSNVISLVVVTCVCCMTFHCGSNMISDKESDIQVYKGCVTLRCLNTAAPKPGLPLNTHISSLNEFPTMTPKQTAYNPAHR